MIDPKPLALATIGYEGASLADFIGLSFDQILNHASKFNFVYNSTQSRLNFLKIRVMGSGLSYDRQDYYINSVFQLVNCINNVR